MTFSESEYGELKSEVVNDLCKEILAFANGNIEILTQGRC